LFFHNFRCQRAVGMEWRMGGGDEFVKFHGLGKQRSGGLHVAEVGSDRSILVFFTKPLERSAMDSSGNDKRAGILSPRRLESRSQPALVCRIRHRFSCPGPDSIRARPRRLRPKPGKEARGNPTGRPENAGSRAHPIPPGDLKKATVAEKYLTKRPGASKIRHRKNELRDQLRPPPNRCSVAFFSRLTADSAFFTSSAPFPPGNPIFPPSSPPQRLFQGPPAESKYRADPLPPVSGERQ
jgi:hypothetical protein